MAARQPWVGSAPLESPDEIMDKQQVKCQDIPKYLSFLKKGRDGNVALQCISEPKDQQVLRCFK